MLLSLFLFLLFADVTTPEFEIDSSSNQTSSYENITCILSIQAKGASSPDTSNFSIYHQSQLPLQEIHQRIDELNTKSHSFLAVGCFPDFLPHQMIDLFSHIENKLNQMCHTELKNVEAQNIHSKLNSLTRQKLKSCRLKIQQSLN